MGKIIVKGITYGGGDCANQNLADEFSESSTYAIDDYIIYQDDLYQCTTAVSTAGPWDNTKWTKVQITDVMGGSSVSALEDLTDVDITNPAANDTIKWNPSTQKWENGAGGEGGGGSYSETTLWNGTQASTGEGVSILLSDDISNYDAIIIDCGRQSGNDYRHGYVWYPVSDLYTGLWYLQIINTNDNCTAYWEYTSNTSITWASAYSAYPVTLFSVKGIKFGGGGGSFEGLDYDRAIDLTLPDYTGYTYTPTEPGAIITKSYGSVGSTRILFNDEEYSLAYIGDTWTTPWLLVPATEITIKRGSSTGTYPSGSYIQFVPYKTGGGTGGGGNVDDVYVNGESVLDVNKIAQIKSYKEVTQAEYDALPATKLTDNILYCIKDQATADTTVAPIIYSEEEREVGVWTDGKPLYQTTIHTGALTKDGNWHTIAHNIPNIDKIILCIGTVYAADNTAYSMPNYRPGLTQGICLDATSINIEYIQNWLDSSPDSYVTLQYTKTTDQPGSGKYAPSGVPSVHYSENEQVVGTWVDGSTVYEKTLYLASGQINASTSLSLPTQSDIERLIFYDGSVYDVNDQRYYAIPYERISAIEGIWLQCHVLSDHTLTPILFTRQSQTYSLADIYITLRYTKTTS